MLVSSSAVSGDVPSTAPATSSRPGTRPQLVPNPASNWSHARRSISWCLTSSSAKRRRDHRRVSSPYTSARAWSITMGTMYSSTKAKMWQ